MTMDSGTVSTLNGNFRAGYLCLAIRSQLAGPDAKPVEVPVQRFLSVLTLCLAVTLPAIAEEITLKDGTKIVGHMTAVSADKIEVETNYGKIQLNRSDIVTIGFPENSAASKGSAPAPAKLEAPKVDESLNGLQYINRTGKFAMTLPPDWVVTPEIRRSPDTLAGLASRDKTRFLLVVQEEYPGSLESYKELNILGARKNLSNFEELAQSPVSIDGQSALLVFYRGTFQTGLPVAFVSAFIQSGKTFTKVTAWCVEPLFRDMQPAFEKILNSYHSTGGQTTAASGSAKP